MNSTPAVLGISHITITRDIFIKKIKKIKTSKAPGPSNIYPKILKELHNEIADNLVH